MLKFPDRNSSREPVISSDLSSSSSREPVISSDLSSSSLRAKLNRGLQEAISQVPAQFRPTVRLLLPQCQTFLQRGSDEDLTKALVHIRNIIDELLAEENGPAGTDTEPE